MRYLVFDRSDESKWNYVVLYTALVSKPDYTRPQIRLMHRVASKFDVHGRATDDTGIRELHIPATLLRAVIELEDGEWQLIDSALNSIPFVGGAHAHVVTALDFFENAPTKLPQSVDGTTHDGAYVRAVDD